MKTLKRIVLFSACAFLMVGCGKSDLEEGIPIADPSADATAETTPPTPEELEAMQNKSE
jgi:hypothetical protein|tara:strand:- start:374 stop:550 length:177 start_codon:yes stop_codon:yes gene_type:complete